MLKFTGNNAYGTGHTAERGQILPGYRLSHPGRIEDLFFASAQQWPLSMNMEAGGQ